MAAALATVWTGSAANPATAQARTAGSGDAYPSRPIRYVVPFAPGGGNDVIGRIVGQRLGDLLGASIVIDNRGGAGGAVGSEIVARSAPDGYTLIMAGVGSHAVNPHVHAKLGYDPVKSFAAVSQLASAPFITVVHPSVPVKNIPELIALAKAKPGQINYASAGTGSSAHLVVEIFRSQAGIQLTHVPYKGTGPALTDTLAGQVQMMFGSMPPTLPHVRTGRLRALGVSSLKRSPVVPDVPAIAEAGVPDFEVVTWYGVMAPAGTPAPIIAKLNTAIVATLQHPPVVEALSLQGANPLPSTPAKFAELVRSEVARYGKVIREAGIKGGV
jgi:tripartite-type tricarboxylate transporter receptor subunit TctC